LIGAVWRRQEEKSMTSPLRIAVVGLDHWYVALAELDGATRTDRVTVVGLAHRDGERAAAVATQYGVPHWSTDPAAIIQRADVDLVVTAGTTSENRHLCELAAQAGKHIVSVKPIAMTVADAVAIAAAVKASGVHFFSFESAWRINPIYQQIKAWVDAGRIGRVISAYTLLRAPLPPWPGERGRTWWLDATQAPAGGWLDHAIYHIDFLRWLLNDEIATVSGEFANLIDPSLPFEDYGAALLRFQGGTQAIMEVTWTGVTDSLAQVHIVGTAGQIVYDQSLTGKLAITGQTDPPGWLLTVPPRPPSAAGNLGSPATHLAAVLAEGGRPVAGIDDAVRNLTAGLAVYEAARQGRRLPLDRST
jgi:predicted dehydrogenase